MNKHKAKTENYANEVKGVVLDQSARYHPLTWLLIGITTSLIFGLWILAIPAFILCINSWRLRRNFKKSLRAAQTKVNYCDINLLEEINDKLDIIIQQGECNESIQKYIEKSQLSQQKYKLHNRLNRLDFPNTN